MFASLSIFILAKYAVKISWCKVEVTVSDPKDINPLPESDPNAPKDMPPLTVMSLSARTIVNHKDNIREVVCATARIWSNSKDSHVLVPLRY